MTNSNYDPNLVNQFLKHDYHDRGMMKWQGFFLSDHTANINKTSREQEEVNRRHHGPAMEQDDIAEIINQAIVKSKHVQIELGEQTIDGIVQKPISGLIQGWIDQQIFIGDQSVMIEDIWAIKVI
ncbi:hypothetical protein [Latilactobacillus phage TMW 1.1365 P3]|uniref:hypothetical protein n=1 Tax=Latilactobacillus curvatus TaxID=28038 RepID=UPI00240FC450|nr:hypothetical protein [Latilactobacillus curvatus]MDG2981215.1 hypothetical protein [Latilactobacillus curvatus]WEU69621.1 hypothetical protein [Latilactobacillus phage TMW 1.1365 P3]